MGFIRLLDTPQAALFTLALAFSLAIAIVLGLISP